MKHTDIKNAKEKFNKENGNKNISQKDMIIYIMEKLDKLPCEAHSAVFMSTKGKVDALCWAIGIGFPILASLVVYHILSG